jgi:hypothetical protein
VVLLQGVRHLLDPFEDRGRPSARPPSTASSRPRFPSTPPQSAPQSAPPPEYVPEARPGLGDAPAVKPSDKPWSRHEAPAEETRPHRDEESVTVSQKSQPKPEVPTAKELSSRTDSPPVESSRPGPPSVPPPEFVPSSPPIKKHGDFSDFVKLVKEKRPTLSGTLALVRPLEFGPRCVRLGCESAFDHSTINSEEVLKFLNALFRDFFGVTTVLLVERTQRPKEGQQESMPKTLQEADVTAAEQIKIAKMQKARLRPAVKAIQEELNAEIGRIRVLGGE